MSYNTLSELFKGICDAIRNKEGSTGVINHQDIPARIEAMTTSGSSCGLELWEPQTICPITMLDEEDIIFIEEEVV